MSSAKRADHPFLLLRCVSVAALLWVGCINSASIASAQGSGAQGPAATPPLPDPRTTIPEKMEEKPPPVPRAPEPPRAGDGAGSGEAPASGIVITPPPGIDPEMTVPPPEGGAIKIIPPPGTQQPPSAK